MEKLYSSTLSDGAGHHVEVLCQETKPMLNEYGCYESIRYMLMSDNSMYVDRLIDGSFVAAIVRID